MSDRLSDFIDSLEPDESPLLRQIELSALAAGVPIVRRQTGAFLKSMVALLQPSRILEVGTAVGYSALLMATRLPPQGTITCIERDAGLCQEALSNWDKAGERRLHLLQGEADDLLQELAPGFELIFLDAAKAQYPVWLPRLTELLAPGGALIADNVLQQETIADSRFDLPRRDRTIHRRMREFLRMLKTSPELTSCVLPVGDGVALAVKR